MKVAIKDLRPNPFRNIDHYPIDEEKVAALAASIEQTGFWDNILARKVDGKIEIAYGHHRLAALRKVKKPGDEVDIPVKALDDATMLKVMANENMDEWRTAPGVIDETIRAARDFLEKHPEEVKKIWKDEDRPGGPVGPSIGKTLLSRFLGRAWNEARVRYALERLGLIDEGVIEPEAVRALPTERSARDFVVAVKQFKPTKEQQKRAAATIARDAKRGPTAVRAAVTEQIYRKKKPDKGIKIIELREEIKTAEKLARDLSTKLLTLTEFRAEIKDEVYRTEIKALAVEFNVLIQALKSFIGEKKNVRRLKG